MAAYFLIQFMLLLADRLVPVSPTPSVNAPHGAAESIGGRLAFDDPLTSSRSRPEVGETEEVECPGTLIRWLASTSRRRRRYTEWDQLRLIGMDRHAVLAEPLRQGTITRWASRWSRNPTTKSSAKRMRKAGCRRRGWTSCSNQRSST